MNKVEQVTSYIENEIKSERFTNNQKIMSIREACDFFNVSKNTIVEAYDRLVALGYLKSKPGSGYFVNNHPKKHDSSKKPLIYFTSSGCCVIIIRTTKSIS
ncbi:winged helix-turn-helix domain-containing protein [Pelistega indica]|uniref:winged helix-turn-helix domain-containing protein n=1 Tax=Pelistega indica TaxID=1414851 RepID=UPI0009DF4D63|nr:winged helix-turn-helix domain-containing protein [Pelistega indica]